ncbi:NAD-dependent epimerase/dehydratase family protein [Artemisia annua]|uniref:MYB transcription factor n=1 Tax=Artemisia annua TaxID=35608 RepID=A0A2U1PHY7_ARTAN|nr:NAD-dependent epimerase/dehydratase family protein [Artemisia annua]
MTKHKHRWTYKEAQALFDGVDAYGTGKWKEILKDPRFSAILVDRSNVDLKDKWRNIHAGLNGSRSRGKVKTLTTRKNTNPRLTYPVPLAVISPIEYGGSSHVEHGGSSHLKYGGSSHIEYGGGSIEYGGRPHIEHGGRPHIEHGGRPHIEHGGRPHIEHGGSPHIEHGDRLLIEHGGSPHTEHGGSPHIEHGGRPHIEHGGSPQIEHGGSPHIEHGGSPHIEHGGIPHIEHSGRLHIEHGGIPHIQHGGSSANKKPPPTHGEMISEAPASIEDPNGLNLDAICYSIEVDDCYKFKDNHNKEDAEPAGAETVEEIASTAAFWVAAAENRELAAIKGCEKADKLAELLAESIAGLQAAEEIYEKCKREGYVLFAS